MARAVWKGPFVEESLMKKVDKYKIDPKKIPIKKYIQSICEQSPLIPYINTSENKIGFNEAPIKKDEIIGKFIVFYDDELIGEYDLLTAKKIDKVNIFTRLIKSLNYQPYYIIY